MGRGKGTKCGCGCGRDLSNSCRCDREYADWCGVLHIVSTAQSRSGIPAPVRPRMPRIHDMRLISTRRHVCPRLCSPDMCVCSQTFLSGHAMSAQPEMFAQPKHKTLKPFTLLPNLGHAGSARFHAPSPRMRMRMQYLNTKLNRKPSTSRAVATKALS